MNDITSNSSGGSFYIDNNAMNILMNASITFTNGMAISGQGGVFYVKNANIIDIENSTFFEFFQLLIRIFFVLLSPYLEPDYL